MIKYQGNFILSINCGSSSLKFCLFQFSNFELVLEGNFEGIGTGTCHFQIKDLEGNKIENKNEPILSLRIAVRLLIKWLKNHFLFENIRIISHRLVQGGPEHRDPRIISDSLLGELKEFIYLAPNHLPEELRTIQSFLLAFPKTPQVACFDTGFHKNLPDFIKHFPIPKAYQSKGLLKYGFHGLSYTYILQKLLEEDKDRIHQKIIIAHLGNGASMAAINKGICLDTTMGISPLGGLVMSTRIGDLDPGLLLFLMKQFKLRVNQLDNLLSKESGLKAVSGISDMKELLSKSQEDSKAAEAIKLFTYEARKYLGALAAALGGLDILVFTGGIGANSPIIREEICKELGFLGIELDFPSNIKGIDIISRPNSRVKVFAMKTDEELVLAKMAFQIIQ